MRMDSVQRKLGPVISGLAALLISADAFAQVPTAGQPERQFTAHFKAFNLIGAGCPVSLTASQRGIGRQLETASAVPARPEQGLTVTVVGKRALRIASVEVVAHALSGRNRALLTSNTPEPDVTRSFQLASKNESGFSSDLWMDGVTSIRWIEVKSITYANGTVWHESETQKCSVRPNPFTLISSAR